MDRKPLIFCLLALALLASCEKAITNDMTPFVLPAGIIEVSFAAAADMREYSGNDMDYFRGACERIAYGGAGDFMVLPGDIDPLDRVSQTISTYIGAEYPCIPWWGTNCELKTPRQIR